MIKLSTTLMWNKTPNYSSKEGKIKAAFMNNISQILGKDACATLF
jgi:hypothetical protein